MIEFLSKYQCGFCKGYSNQHCLPAMLEKGKFVVDKGNYSVRYRQIYLSHEFLLAKLPVYGFSIAALRLIHGYLTNRKQRTKVNLSYSTWEEILFCVPYGSILGPLVFIIFLSDLFFIRNETEFSSYADDITPYRTVNTVDEVIQSLEHGSLMLFQWFSDNQIRANI